MTDYFNCSISANVFKAEELKKCLEEKGYTKELAKEITIEKANDIYYCGEIVKGGTATKLYNGTPLSCLRNDGSYSFNQHVEINSTDIVSVQQNSEQEYVNGTPFSVGRNHYRSTVVKIDNVHVAPDTAQSHFPYYPVDIDNGGIYLRTWDNTTSTFSLMFPYAGSFELYFYNKHYQLMAKETLELSDFSSLSYTKAKQLLLGKKMKLAPGIEEDIEKEDGTLELKANRTDDWVEWGGGVFGGRHSKTGQTSQSPNDDYVIDNAVEKVVIKDLITGSIVPIKLVYPLPYPNRVFISKLKVYEHRKYRCYGDYNQVPIGGNGELTYICNTNQKWQEYQDGLVDNLDGVQQWQNEELCQNNCRDYKVCTTETRTINDEEKQGWTCSSKGGQNIGGDLEGNFFSNELNCNSACYSQNSCTSYTDNQCVKISENETHKITDHTGKTVSTRKDLVYRCDKRVDIETGCAKYASVTTEGEVDFNIMGVGYETKDFTKAFEDAMTSANMLEVGTQHIWSGWKGTCVKGKKWDFSYLSDPMTIVSYAMQAYSSWNYMSGGADLDKAGQTANETGEKAAKAQEALKAATDAGVTGAELAALQTAANAAQAAADAAAQALSNVYNNMSSIAKQWEAFKYAISSKIDSAYAGIKDSVGGLFTDGAGNISGTSESLQGIPSNVDNTVNDIGKGLDKIKDTTNSGGSTSLLDTIKEKLGMDINNVSKMPDINTPASENLEAQRELNKNIIKQVAEKKSLTEQAKELLKGIELEWDKSVIGDKSSFINITQGDLIKFGAQAAITLAAPSEAEYKLAERLMGGYAGTNVTTETQNYNACMASIGASLPNLVGWSSSSDPSKELMMPWEHVLRLTPMQLAAISTVTSENYVMSHYMIDNSVNSLTSPTQMSTILVDVVAISPDAYLKAANAVCMGTKTFQASEHISYENNKKDEDGGGMGAGDVALMLVKMIISYYCPPCGFVLTIITDLFTNVFASVNTCKNEMDAMQWDMLHYKTYKFLNFDQCIQTRSYCDEKSSWFGCVRKGYDYCCFDQITTKIFAEGLKEQLYPAGTSPEVKWQDCAGITINDLQNISFQECGPNQDPYINKCFPTSKYSEFQQTLFRQASKGIDISGLTEQVINSMAIEKGMD